MNRINAHDIEPGPYVDDRGFEVVVTDVVTHGWNAVACLQEVLSEPLVVGRNLVMGEERYVWPLSVFKEKYVRY